MSRIGVALLGAGIFAREEHLPAILAAQNMTLKAVYSRSLKSAQALATDSTSSVNLYSDDSGPDKTLSSLLARPDIAGVVIALPINAQPSYIRQALEAGKHVLSEKPIAPTVEEAHALIAWYRAHGGEAKWSVAENFRYQSPFLAASNARKSLGRTLGFRVNVHTLINPGEKYFETEWRKTPSHQGGFLLDGGVHFVAGLRMLLDEPLVSVSANTAQLQAHLPPVDTVDATARTQPGATGVISISFGSTYSDSEWSVACEKGVVRVSGQKVTVGEEEREVGQPEEAKSGVPAEVRDWGEAVNEGQGMVNERQRVEEALADLEVIEACLKSGKLGGEGVALVFQNWYME